MSDKNTTEKRIRKSYRFLIVICAIALIAGIIALYFGGPTEETSEIGDDPSENLESDINHSGFIEDEGVQTVINNCTTCHAAELVTQNKMTKEGWLATIRWMQESQNLWDLGDNEAIILNYLAKNYAPEDTGRRPALKDIEWYALK
ncbi:monoheme cytochrome C [Aurantibacter crassamenti]|uniref:monoheme cytochrome C n=1 Tax=Aurantibacter crassamenti TaxID=1837375 RepID=UPI00193A05ED|nr:monoheme cytochrome C [Aurantibacter crassamenti]MBM1106895.1 monoheme cytochrome C [Aurantibacter crassamenti]